MVGQGAYEFAIANNIITVDPFSLVSGIVIIVYFLFILYII